MFQIDKPSNPDTLGVGNYSCPICGKYHGEGHCAPRVYERIDEAEATARRAADREPPVPQRSLRKRLEEGFEMLDEDYGMD